VIAWPSIDHRAWFLATVVLSWRRGRDATAGCAQRASWPSDGGTAAQLVQELGDPVFVVLLVEARKVEQRQLGNPGQGRQVAVEVPRLVPGASDSLPSLKHPPAKHGAEAQHGRAEWPAADLLADQGDPEVPDSVAEVIVLVATPR
jgi:hypothetical protein